MNGGGDSKENETREWLNRIKNLLSKKEEKVSHYGFLANKKMKKNIEATEGQNEKRYTISSTCSIWKDSYLTHIYNENGTREVRKILFHFYCFYQPRTRLLFNLEFLLLITESWNILEEWPAWPF